MFTKDVVNIILNSLIFSKLFYRSTVWSGTFKQNINKLQRMKNQGTALLVRQETLHLFNQCFKKKARVEISYGFDSSYHFVLFYHFVKL